MSGSSSSHLSHSSFIDQESLSTSNSFHEPNCQEQYLESVSFSVSPIVIHPAPITTLLPLHTPFTP